MTCMGAIVKGNSVVCKHGHKLLKVGRQTSEGFPLVAVLRGR